jgi:hypothetical protein
MASELQVDLFVEDSGHEAFISPLVARIAAEENRYINAVVRSARGGHGRVLEELELYQRGVLKGIAHLEAPDLLVVAIDANCKRYNRAKADIADRIQDTLRSQTVIACPDPHIERWYMSDSTGFAKVVGTTPKLARKKCEKDKYKALLAQSVVDGGHVSTLGGIEFANEIVQEMDFYRGGKAEPSLEDFVADLRVALKRF